MSDDDRTDDRDTYTYHFTRLPGGKGDPWHGFAPSQLRLDAVTDADGKPVAEPDDEQGVPT